MGFLFVSIPNGLHRPFRHLSILIPAGASDCFNPERASQAIPTQASKRNKLNSNRVSIPNGLHRPFRQPRLYQVLYQSLCRFQSRTGFTGHSDETDNFALVRRRRIVSIPNGLHRPFRPALKFRRRSLFSVSIPNGLHRPFRLLIL